MKKNPEGFIYNCNRSSGYEASVYRTSSEIRSGRCSGHAASVRCGRSAVCVLPSHQPADRGQRRR